MPAEGAAHRDSHELRDLASVTVGEDAWVVPHGDPFRPAGRLPPPPATFRHPQPARESGWEVYSDKTTVREPLDAETGASQS